MKICIILLIYYILCVIKSKKLRIKKNKAKSFEKIVQDQTDKENQDKDKTAQGEEELDQGDSGQQDDHIFAKYEDIQYSRFVDNDTLREINQIYFHRCNMKFLKQGFIELTKKNHDNTTIQIDILRLDKIGSSEYLIPTLQQYLIQGWQYNGYDSQKIEQALFNFTHLNLQIQNTSLCYIMQEGLYTNFEKKIKKNIFTILCLNENQFATFEEEFYLVMNQTILQSSWERFGNYDFIEILLFCQKFVNFLRFFAYLYFKHIIQYISININMKIFYSNIITINLLGPAEYFQPIQNLMYVDSECLMTKLTKVKGILNQNSVLFINDETNNELAGWRYNNIVDCKILTNITIPQDVQQFMPQNDQCMMLDLYRLPNEKTSAFICVNDLNREFAIKTIMELQTSFTYGCRQDLIKNQIINFDLGEGNLPDPYYPQPPEKEPVITESSCPKDDDLQLNQSEDKQNIDLSLKKEPILSFDNGIKNTLNKKNSMRFIKKSKKKQMDQKIQKYIQQTKQTSKNYEKQFGDDDAVIKGTFQNVFGFN